MKIEHTWFNTETGAAMVSYIKSATMPEGYQTTKPVKTAEQISVEQTQKLEGLYISKVDKLTLEAVLKANADNPLFADAWAAREAAKLEVADGVN